MTITAHGPLKELVEGLVNFGLLVSPRATSAAQCRNGCLVFFVGSPSPGDRMGGWFSDLPLDGDIAGRYENIGPWQDSLTRIERGR
jgi:hypothetical protein